MYPLGNSHESPARALQRLQSLKVGYVCWLGGWQEFLGCASLMKEGSFRAQRLAALSGLGFLALAAKV